MPFVIAIDYDGTIVEDLFPKLGEPIVPVVNKIKEFKKIPNCEVILWTCREGAALDEAIQRCKQFGIELDAVNENSFSQYEWRQKLLKQTGHVFAHRKIFANIYVDDRSPGSIEYFLNMNIDEMRKSFG